MHAVGLLLVKHGQLVLGLHQVISHTGLELHGRGGSRHGRGAATGGGLQGGINGLGFGFRGHGMQW